MFVEAGNGVAGLVRLYHELTGRMAELDDDLIGLRREVLAIREKAGLWIAPRRAALAKTVAKRGAALDAAFRELTSSQEEEFLQAQRDRTSLTERVARLREEIIQELTHGGST